MSPLSSSLRWRGELKLHRDNLTGAGKRKWRLTAVAARNALADA